MSFLSMLQAASRDADSRKYDDIYAGHVSLASLGVTLPPETRVLEMAAPYPQLAVDVLAEVLTPEGFVCRGFEDQLSLVWSWWQANNMDTLAKLAFTDAMVRGVVYWTAAKLPDGRMRFQALSPDSATVEYDYAGDVVEGIWRYRLADGVDAATYYTPGETVMMERRMGQWRVGARTVTGADRPTIVPMANRTRLDQTRGLSELEQVIRITDAASRSLTNLQVAQELLAWPVRGLFGDKINDQFKPGGKNGGRRKIDVYMGGLVTGPAGSELKQLPGAELRQIIETVKLYAMMVSAQTGIPPSMLGISTDNPSSAEAMRAAKERLITRAEFKQAVFGDSLEALALLALQLDGVDVSGMDTLECVWRDPATPSVSAKAANALQAQAQGVITAETAREFLALTPEQKRREAARSSFLTDWEIAEEAGPSLVEGVGGESAGTW